MKPIVKLLKKQPKGFTLIELLIYMSIVTLAVVVFTSFMVDVTKSAARVKNTKEVQQNARLLLERLTYEIRTSKEIVSVNPGNTELTLKNNSDITTRFTLSNDGVYYDNDINDGNPAVLLSNDKVSLDLAQSKFERITNTINIILNVKQKNQAASAAEKSQINLSSTIVPRSSLY